MSPLRENWYVYYPAPTSPGSALPLLRAMQAQLTGRNGISARVEERVDSGKRGHLDGGLRRRDRP